MPLSKKRQAERMRAKRAGPWYRTGPSLIKPRATHVQPNDDALQSISIKRETDSTVPPVSIEEAINRGRVACCVEIEDVFPSLVSAAKLVQPEIGQEWIEEYRRVNAEGQIEDGWGHKLNPDIVIGDDPWGGVPHKESIVRVQPNCPDGRYRDKEG